MSVTTGWYGVPMRAGSHSGRSTNVHVRKEDGTCLCGYKAHKNYEYQWCSPGINMDYVNCKGCLEKSEKLLLTYDKGKYNEYIRRKTSKNEWRTNISFMR